MVLSLTEEKRHFLKTYNMPLFASHTILRLGIVSEFSLLSLL